MTRRQRVVVASLLAVFGLSVASPLIAVVGPAALVGVAAIRRRRLLRSHDHQIDLAVVEFVDRIGQALRGGGSLASSVGEAIDGLAPSPLRDRTEAARSSLRAGDGLRSALTRTDQSGQASLELVVTALGVLLEMGGPAAVALDRLSDTVRLGVGAREEARAQSSQAAASATLLAAMPIVFGSIVALVEPDVAAFYLRTWTGAVTVGVAGSLSFIGWWWMQEVVEPCH